MARKTNHKYKVFDAVAATSTQTSEQTIVFGIDKLSYHCKFSANNSGEFTLLAQNHENDSWLEVPFSGAMTITADNEALIMMNEVPFYALQLVWTPSAGSGTLTTFLNMKAVGS